MLRILLLATSIFSYAQAQPEYDQTNKVIVDYSYFQNVNSLMRVSVNYSPIQGYNFASDQNVSLMQLFMEGTSDTKQSIHYLMKDFTEKFYSDTLGTSTQGNYQAWQENVEGTCHPEFKVWAENHQHPEHIEASYSFKYQMMISSSGFYNLLDSTKYFSGLVGADNYEFMGQPGVGRGHTKTCNGCFLHRYGGKTASFASSEEYNPNKSQIKKFNYYLANTECRALFDHQISTVKDGNWATRVAPTLRQFTSSVCGTIYLDGLADESRRIPALDQNGINTLMQTLVYNLNEVDPRHKNLNVVESAYWVKLLPIIKIRKAYLQEGVSVPLEVVYNATETYNRPELRSATITNITHKLVNKPGYYSKDSLINTWDYDYFVVQFNDIMYSANHDYQGNEDTYKNAYGFAKNTSHATEIEPIVPENPNTGYVYPGNQQEEEIAASENGTVGVVNNPAAGHYLRLYCYSQQSNIDRLTTSLKKSRIANIEDKIVLWNQKRGCTTILFGPYSTAVSGYLERLILDQFEEDNIDITSTTAIEF